MSSSYNSISAKINNIAPSFKNMDAADNVSLSPSATTYINGMKKINKQIGSCCDEMAKALKKVANRSDTGSESRKALDSCIKNINAIKRKCNYRFSYISDKFNEDYQLQMQRMLDWWQKYQEASQQTTSASNEQDY